MSPKLKAEQHYCSDIVHIIYLVDILHPNLTADWHWQCKRIKMKVWVSEQRDCKGCCQKMPGMPVSALPQVTMAFIQIKTQAEEKEKHCKNCKCWPVSLFYAEIYPISL